MFSCIGRIAIAALGVTMTCGVLAQTPGPAKAPLHETLQAAHKAASPERQLTLRTKAWKGDLDGMLERRMIRVDAPYSRTLFYIDKGRERGLASELVRDFERWLNQKYAKELGKRPLTIYIGAFSRDKLLPDLAEGYADIAVGNITVTPERLAIVDFVAPEGALKTNEIVVTGPKSPKVETLDDLSGKTVHVRRASSYFDSLETQNAKFKEAGKAPIKIVFVPDALEDEDMMQMMNSGLLDIMVVDDWKAKIWAQAYPKDVLHEDIKLREGSRIGWAIRKDTPKLKAAITEFYNDWVKKQGVINYRLAREAKRVKTLGDPSANSDFKRFEDTVAVFVTYGREYDFDPLLLAAQGYQESTLDQNKRSRVGAIGVMQIMPTTGASLKVGDITIMESNIHAGAKYMNEIITKYFSDAHFDNQNRTLFAFASYNAGPGNISKMRKEAAARGLDPDKWFNNVEVVVAEKIGMETTTYVRNIYKYYAAYRLILDAQERAAKARAILAK